MTTEIEIFQQMSYNLGNAMRELWRFQMEPHSGTRDIEALRRAQGYITNEIGRFIGPGAATTEPATGKLLLSKTAKS